MTSDIRVRPADEDKAEEIEKRALTVKFERRMSEQKFCFETATEVK
jgi:hypothetical protein